MANAIGDCSSVADLAWQDFCRIATVMQKESGIELPESKLPLVQARLLRRLGFLNLKSYAEYCDVIEKKGNESERLKMISALTTNVTSFFRESHHFDFLREHVLPGVIPRLKAGEPVRVWSAGCSTGEEPYSIALEFLEADPEIARYDFKILATDIDPVVLNAAVEGVYPLADMAGISDAMRERYFDHEPEQPGLLRVKKSVADLIAFRSLNLVGTWPMRRAFDIIMCRNVVIYFGEATKSDIWTRLLRQLKPDGVLFTGHSERLCGPDANRMSLVATTTYSAAARGSENERTAVCL